MEAPDKMLDTGVVALGSTFVKHQLFFDLC